MAVAGAVHDVVEKQSVNTALWIFCSVHASSQMFASIAIEGNMKIVHTHSLDSEKTAFREKY
jgi:hypothetical protein